jgi:WD40 repeat protein
MSPTFRFLFIVAGLWISFPAAAWAQDKDIAKAEALQDGALQRLGTGRFRLGDALRTALLSPDGKRAAITTSFSGICWMDMATGLVISKKQDHMPYSDDGWALSPDGKVLVSLTKEPAIEIWDIEQKKTRHLLTPQFPPKSVAFSTSGKMIAVGEAGGKTGDVISLWDVAAGSRVHTLQVLQNLSAKAAFSAEGDLLATWGNTYGDAKGEAKDPPPARIIQLWTVATGKELRQIVADGERVDAVAFAPDQKTLAVLTWKGGLQIRDAVTGKLLEKLQPSFDWGKSVQYSPDGRLLVAMDRYGKIQMWETVTWKSKGVAGGPDLRLTSFSFVGKQVLACGLSGQTVLLRDLTDPAKEPAASEHRHVVRTLQFASNRTLLSVDASGQAFLWERDNGKPLGSWKLTDQLPKSTDPNRQFLSSAVSPDGSYLAAYDYVSQKVHVWDLAQKKIVWSTVASRSDLETSLAFTRDNKLAVLTKNVKDPKAGETIVVQDLEAGREVRKITLPPAADKQKRFGFGNVAFSPDGQLLAAAEQYNEQGKVGTEIFVWDLKTGYEKRHLIQDTSYTPVLSFSPDGDLLALGGPKEGMALVNVWTGNLIRMKGVDRSLDALAFSPDGRTIAGTTYFNKDAVATVLVWERRTGTIRCRFEGQWGKIHALAFSPDGRALASAGVDTTIMIWDTTGRQSFAAGKADADTLWARLGREASADAFTAMGQLVGQPESAIALFKKKLPPDKQRVVGPDEIRKWISELDDEKFKVREAAMQGLHELGELALPELHKMMKTKITLEVRLRIEKVMNDIQSTKVVPEELRQRRAVEVLEQIRNPEAQQLLEDISRGSPGALLTQEAQAALSRLKSKK